MNFKVNARTIFHLGAELISSDSVALYELVKNAFDANSPRVKIDILQRTSKESLSTLIAQVERSLQEQDEEEGEQEEEEEEAEEEVLSLPELKVLASQHFSERGDSDFLRRVAEVETLETLLRVSRGANEIVVSDTGEGMSLTDLEQVFLTIGTTSRKVQLDEQRRAKEKAIGRPVLGEKGVGRLSSMRLGKELLVQTAKVEDANLNVLEIDWSVFERESDRLLEEIEIAPYNGGTKPFPSGTVLRISDLNSDWNVSKLETVARDEFSRLRDPFSAETRFPIDLTLNGTAVPIPSFQKVLLKEAHAVVKVSFGPSRKEDLSVAGQMTSYTQPRLTGSVDYRLRHRSLPIDMNGVHLLTLAGATEDVLRALGPFELEVYWYNRPLLEAVDTIGDKRRVMDLVNQWSGGIMVYRDGFRVGGYGSGADDWLGLDRKALAAKGYKVNRAQLIGRLSISSLANPNLVDQTNREGLTDSPEKEALVRILKHIMESVFRPFLDAVDIEVKASEPVNFKDVARRVLTQRRDVADSLRLLYQKYPAVKTDPEIGGRIEEALKAIGDMMRTLSSLGESYEKGRASMTVLAGIGLSVSSVAHELRRATSDALTTVDALRRRKDSLEPSEALAPLGMQLKTLLTRLRVLDPLVTSGRQVKMATDLVTFVPTVVSSVSPGLQAEGIRIETRMLPTEGRPKLEVKIVQGMVVQVVGNLIDNARYWIRRAALHDARLAGFILVEIDAEAREVRVSDNGPGVEPSMRETIFEAFVTSKPVGDGMGLGLYISREVARYSDAELVLLPPDQTAKGMSTTFALQFPRPER